MRRLIKRCDSSLTRIFMILLPGIAAYANSFTVPLQYDDVATLRRFVNKPLTSVFTGGDMRWFTDLTFQLNRFAHGETVVGYHAVNFVIHLTAAFCLCLLVSAAIEAIRSTFSLPADDGELQFLEQFIPLVTAILFVSHPIQTQAVTYISQRYASLAAMLYIGALLAYLRARLTPDRWLTVWWFAVFITVGLLAMGSKETAFTLPLMVLSLEIFLFRGRLLKQPLFLMGLAALLLVIPVRLLFRYGLQDGAGLLQAFGQASSEVQGLLRSEYLLTQVRVIATYLRLLLAPVNQNLDYDYPVRHTLFTADMLAALVLHLLLAAVALLLFLRSRRALGSGCPAAGTALRLASLGIVWFYLALAVESSIIPIRDVICEHRLYLPSAGFFLFAVSLAGLTAAPPARQRAAWWIAALCCLLLTAATIARNRVWSSQLILWSDVLNKSPNKARAHFHVGYELAQRMMPDQALPHLVRAIELNPSGTDFWITLNDVVGALETFEGRHDNGAKYHLTVYAIDPRFQTKWQAVSCNSLGLAYEYLGNYVAARAAFRRSSELNPSLDLAWLNLALVSVKLQDPAGAAAALDRLKGINPGLAGSLPGLPLPRP